VIAFWLVAALAGCFSMLTGPSHVKNLACEDWGVYLSLPSLVDTFLRAYQLRLSFLISSPLLLTTYLLYLQAVTTAGV
jgi:hypothetical protein